MKTKLKNQIQGFTIIEVMIVLTIAGLILLIVFLAVPALQRSSRNTSRKNDVAAVLAAAGDYTANNSGQLPTTSGAFNTEFTGSNANLGYYTAADVTYDYSAATRAAVPAFPTDANTLVIYNNLTCSGNTAVITGTSARSLAALYEIEGSSGLVNQCEAS